MKERKKFNIIRIFIVVLIVALLAPVEIHAATGDTSQPLASYYLNSYNAYIYPAGNGLVQVWFNARGTDYMDELGALRIQIYESTNNSTWTLKATHTNETNPEFLSYNDYYHSGHVDYQGVAGRYYKAYVCIWGGENGAGDTRYFWTSVKKAT